MQYTKRTKGSWVFLEIIMNTYFQFNFIAPVYQMQNLNP